MWKRLIILSVFLIAINVTGFTYMATQVSIAEQNHPSLNSQLPLSLVFLIDASGSMRENDQHDVRKAAAQAVVSLLAPEDEVAIVEFGTKGRALESSQGKSWIRATDREELFGLIQKVGDRDHFTDFRVGLKEAAKVLERSSEARRKVILLLSDGIFEPNPLDQVYNPHPYSYRLAVARASPERRKEINKEYREKLSPIARRIVSEEILPALREREVEIFTVALSPHADRIFLQSLANETTRNPVQVHSFYAMTATDLVKIFTQFLQYWSDMTVLYSEEGEIKPREMHSIFIDEFVKVPRVITFADGEGDFIVETQDGASEESESGMHPSLKSFVLLKNTPPAVWAYGFQSGQGKYSTIWLGKNLLRIVVTGLKRQYEYGEEVLGQVLLRVGESDVNNLLLRETRVVAEVTRMESSESPIKQVLERDGEGYLLRYYPICAGAHEANFIAYAKDRYGREILPRPSLRYQFEVLPNFYVEPVQLNFGKARGGMKLQQEVEIHSGLKNRVDISIASQVTESSSSSFSKELFDRLPAIQETTLQIEPGKIERQSIVMDLPNNVGWGDYEGEVIFQASSGESYKVNFRLHVSSVWESILLLLILLLVLLVSILGYLVYIWGYLGSPSGVLVPLAVPSGELLPPIKLSQVRRGLLSRLLNWRRNRIRIKNKNAEICLTSLPPDLEVELSFYRWGRSYIKNKSAKDSEQYILIEEPDIGSFELGPVKTLGLRHESLIALSEYKFRYENR